MKRKITAVLAASAVLLSSCAKAGAPADNSETTQIESEISFSENTQTESEASLSETTQTEEETEESISENASEISLSGKWTEKNRLYTYEFDDSGNVLIDTDFYEIGGRYELNGEYDLILYLDWQGEYAGDEPLAFGFDVKKTDSGYEMAYHPMDEHGSMPFEPPMLATGYGSALWGDETFVLTAYEQHSAVCQNDVLGLWQIDYGEVLLFAEDNTYCTERYGLSPTDTVIDNGSFELYEEQYNMIYDGERIVMSGPYNTMELIRWNADDHELTGLFSVYIGEEWAGDLWLKNGIGIVRSDPSLSEASVIIDGTDISIKMGDEAVSGIFCPRNTDRTNDGKRWYYKGDAAPCDYHILTENGDITLKFDSFTLYDSQFYEWYTNGTVNY